MVPRSVCSTPAPFRSLCSVVGLLVFGWREIAEAAVQAAAGGWFGGLYDLSVG